MLKQAVLCTAALVLLCAAQYSSAATVYAKKQKVDCDSKGVCKVGLGKAGTVTLPALVAFKSAHSNYMSVSPPNGGQIWLSGHPKAWEEWEMVRVGDKVALKSHHGTWLSQRWNPGDGFEMASERLGHELFQVEEKGDKMALRGHNGMYVSANADASFGLKQEFTAGEWETWTVEYTREGHVAFRSAHGTYLGSSNPHTYGIVSQQPTLNTWETFVIDHVDKEKLTIETSHDTYIAAHADEFHPDKVVTMDRASMWELWKPYVNASTGGVCMQSHDGRFLTAVENVSEGWSLTTHCMEHELVEITLVDEKMLAAAAKAAAEAKKAAAM